MKLKYVCPFCFSEHPINDVEFACEQRMVCEHKDANGNVLVPAGAGEEDPKMAKYKGVQRVRGPHHFRVAKQSKLSLAMPSSAVCDWCHQPSHTRVCPDCHNVLPNTVSSDEEVIVALIGTRSSGKSTYVGVLIHEMMKRLFRPFNGTFQLCGPEDQKRYRDDFEKYLYREHKVVEQTKTHVQSGQTNENRPILGTVKLQSGKFIKKIKAMTLVFFDSAGEDWEDQDKINVVAKYVVHSAGIIFLIDPLSNTNVRSSISDDNLIQRSGSMTADDVSEPAVVIDRVAKLIRNINGLKETQKIGIPVAAAFSKLDVLEDSGMLPPGSALAQPSPHIQLGQFNEADRQAVDQEMRALLATWDQQDFLQALELNYSNSSCFAFSALGRSPESTGDDARIAPPVPKRIEDAMLWILHQRVII